MGPSDNRSLAALVKASGAMLILFDTSLNGTQVSPGRHRLLHIHRV